MGELVTEWSDGEHSVFRTEQLTEEALLRSCTSMISQIPDKNGWVVVALKATLR